MDNILICFGTRPEWLKVKPLLKELKNYRLLFTGQHIDLLKDIEVDYTIKIQDGSNRLDQIISDCLIQFPEGDYDTVLVHGDTVSALACALAAFHRKKKIIHLEGGLRSYNLDHPYPEEGYRQMISRIADINFVPTAISAKHLIQEKVSGKVYIVGNSVLDNLIELKDKAFYGNKVLVTLHRRENHHQLKEWFTQVNYLAKNNPELEFIIPLHHHPEVQKHRDLLPDVKVVDALPHSDLLDILIQSRLIISDSGGLQEEGSFFNKNIIVCRETTERPEGIDSGHLHLCPTPDKLIEIFESLKNNYHINAICPYGDGSTSKKIASIL